MKDDNYEAIKLAREIYKKHPEVINFIFSNKPTLMDDKFLKSIFKYFHESSNKYICLTPDKKNPIRFLPKEVTGNFNHKTQSWSKTESSFALELFINEEVMWLAFCFGAVKVQDQHTSEKLQEIKEKNFESMKEFKSLNRKGVKKKRARATSNYPYVATVAIMRAEDIDDREIFDIFKDKFEEFEKNVLTNWIEEVKQNIPINQIIPQ